MSEWISVEERLPSTDLCDQEYIVYDFMNRKVHHDYFIVPSDGTQPFWNHYGSYVTHWMPPPPLPHHKEPK